MGRYSKERGDAFEGVLARLHDRYEIFGQALVRHQGTIAEYHNGRWMPVESQVDYAGVLRGGRHVSFDAKLISGDHYAHPKSRMHQCKQLWENAALGGVAFLLVMTDNSGLAPLAYHERIAWIIKPQARWTEPKGWSMKLIESDVCIKVPAHADFIGAYIPDWMQLITTGVLQ